MEKLGVWKCVRNPPLQTPAPVLDRMSDSLCSWVHDFLSLDCGFPRSVRNPTHDNFSKVLQQPSNFIAMRSLPVVAEEREMLSAFLPVVLRYTSQLHHNTTPLVSQYFWEDISQPQTSHKRVFTLICWQPGSANTGFFTLRIRNGVGKQGYGNRPLSTVDDRNPIRKFSLDCLDASKTNG